MDAIRKPSHHFFRRRAEQYERLSAWQVCSVVLLFDIVVVSLAIYLEMTTPLQFFKEGYPMTWLSAFHLAATGWTAWLVFRTRDGVAARQDWRFWLKNVACEPYIWLMMAVGFAFLALDELLMLHELADIVIHWAFQIQENAFTDRLDDVIVLGYGVVAAAVFVRYWGELKRYPVALPFVVLGVFCAFLMVFFDAVTNQNDIVPLFFGGDSDKIYNNLKLFEEGFKIWAEAFFLIAVFFCYEKAREFSDNR